MFQPLGQTKLKIGRRSRGKILAGLKSGSSLPMALGGGFWPFSFLLGVGQSSPIQHLPAEYYHWLE